MAIVREYEARTVGGLKETRFRLVRSKKKPLKAGDRKGFNSRSGMASMLDPKLAEVERPTVDKVVQLIKVQYVGYRDKESGEIKDVLTAQGHALFEFLMAAARIQGIEQPEFRVPMTDAKEFLNIKHNDRLKALSQQLNDTKVRYDFATKEEQWDGLMNLLSVDYVTTRGDGKKYLSYIIHPRVKRVITESTRWAKLDINAYPKFKSKYTARIYPHFQLHAQTYAGIRKPLIIEPLAFAEMIGFVHSGQFHFGNFEKGCLKPIMRDFDDFSLSLSVQMMPYHRGQGRGNPVSHLEFHLEPREYLRPMGDGKLRRMEGAEFDNLAKLIREDERTVKEFHPTAALLLKAALRLNREPVDLLETWRDDVSKAFAYPTMEILLGLRGQELCDLLETRGGPAAFELWAMSVDPVVESQWLPTEEEWDRSRGLEQRVIISNPETGYTLTALRRVNQPESFPSQLTEIGKIISRLRAIPDGELENPESIDELKQLCCVEHPAFRHRFGRMFDEEWDDVHSAMLNAALDRPTAKERIDFLIKILKLADQPISEDSSASIGKIARTFTQLVQRR